METSTHTVSAMEEVWQCSALVVVATVDGILNVVQCTNMCHSGKRQSQRPLTPNSTKPLKHLSSVRRFFEVPMDSHSLTVNSALCNPCFMKDQNSMKSDRANVGVTVSIDEPSTKRQDPTQHVAAKNCVRCRRDYRFTIPSRIEPQPMTTIATRGEEKDVIVAYQARFLLVDSWKEKVTIKKPQLDSRIMCLRCCVECAMDANSIVAEKPLRQVATDDKKAAVYQESVSNAQQDEASLIAEICFVWSKLGQDRQTEVNNNLKGIASLVSECPLLVGRLIALNNFHLEREQHATAQRLSDQSRRGKVPNSADSNYTLTTQRFDYNTPVTELLTRAPALMMACWTVHQAVPSCRPAYLSSITMLSSNSAP